MSGCCDVRIGTRCRPTPIPTASAFASFVLHDESLTPEDYERARRLLMRRDPILGGVVKQIGPCGLAARQRNDHLTALIGAIVSQQLSTKAAATIFGRFVALFPAGEIPGAPAIEEISAEALRGVGLSGQKIGYLRDLAHGLPPSFAARGARRADRRD